MRRVGHNVPVRNARSLVREARGLTPSVIDRYDAIVPGRERERDAAAARAEIENQSIGRSGFLHHAAPARALVIACLSVWITTFKWRERIVVGAPKRHITRNIY